MAESKSIKRNHNFKDLTGQRFGRLIVIDEATGRARVHWNCICDCGTPSVVSANFLLGGRTKSCGCLHKEKFTFRKHGESKSKLYYIWLSMISRCHDLRDAAYDRYGGRGIVVCDRWRKSFEAFRDDMGPRPEGRYSVDRRNNSKGYCPENCRWANDFEQARNSRKNRILEHAGKRHCVSEWAQILGISPGVLHSRLNSYGWSVEKTLTTPVKRGCHRPMRP